MDKKLIAENIKKLAQECLDFYGERNSYVKGYLDGLFELCRFLGIKATRSEFNLHIEEVVSE